MLVAAVNSQDVAVCKNYFSIFCNIQRESEFRNYYYGSRKTPLLELWQNARLRDCETGPDSSQTQTLQTFAQFLPSFYSAFLSMLSTERASISAIFPDPQPTLSTLITSTLSSLQPSFSERLSSVSAHHGAKALSQLTRGPSLAFSTTIRRSSVGATEPSRCGTSRLESAYGIS